MEDDDAKPILMNEAQYIAFERLAEERHEYRDGFVHLVPPSTIYKSRIGVGFLCTLSAALHQRRFEILPCSMRVHIPASGWYVYPECSVISGRGVFRSEVDFDSLLNPCLIVRIFTRETEDYDRGDKFTHYKTIPSLAHYVLASQVKPFVEVFTRQGDDSWTCKAYEAGQKIELPALECEVAIDQIYANVFDLVAEA